MYTKILLIKILVVINKILKDKNYDLLNLTKKLIGFKEINKLNGNCN